MLDTMQRPLTVRAAEALEEYRAEADADWAKEAAQIAEAAHAGAWRELERITAAPIDPRAVTVDPATFTARAELDGVQFIAPHVPKGDGIVRWYLAASCPECHAATWTETFPIDLRTLGVILDTPQPRLAAHNQPGGDERCGDHARARPGDPEPRHVFRFGASMRQLEEHYDRIASRCRRIEFKQMGTGVALIGELWPVPTSEGDKF